MAYQYRYNKVCTVCLPITRRIQVVDMGGERRVEGAAKVARVAKMKGRTMQKLGRRFIAALVVETGLCRIGRPESEH